MKLIKIYQKEQVVSFGLECANCTKEHGEICTLVYHVYKNMPWYSGGGIV